jgi:hypothetical protein
MGRYGLDWSDSGWGPMESFCEHYDEPFASMKGREILDWLPLEKGSAPWS